MKLWSRGILLCCLPVALLLLAACAPTDLVLKPTYLPVGDSKGAGGPLVLATVLTAPSKADGAEQLKYVYGEIKDSDGKVIGNVESLTSPAVLVRDALQMELLKAGYMVQLATELPKGVPQGVQLSVASVTMDEVNSLVRMEAQCKVQVTLDLWKNGALVRKLTYGKNVSDFAVRDREKLHRELLQKALGTVMKDAVADLVTYLK